MKNKHHSPIQKGNKEKTHPCPSQEGNEVGKTKTEEYFENKMKTEPNDKLFKADSKINEILRKYNCTILYYVPEEKLCYIPCDKDPNGQRKCRNCENDLGRIDKAVLLQNDESRYTLATIYFCRNCEMMEMYIDGSFVYTNTQSKEAAARQNKHHFQIREGDVEIIEAENRMKANTIEVFDKMMNTAAEICVMVVTQFVAQKLGYEVTAEDKKDVNNKFLGIKSEMIQLIENADIKKYMEREESEN